MARSHRNRGAARVTNRRDTTAVNPTKVLLVINSNAAFGTGQSIDAFAIADWYANARGLDDGLIKTNDASAARNSYHWISFDFGDTTKSLATISSGFTGSSYVIADDLVCTGASTKSGSGIVGQSFFAALAQVINGNQIQCVFSTPGVGIALLGTMSYENYSQAVELMMASAQRLVAVTPSQRRFTYSTLYRQGSAPDIFAQPHKSAFNRVKPFYADTLPSDLTQWGRVGWGDKPLSFGQPHTFSNLSDVKTIVNNGIAAEKEVNLGKKHVIGGTIYISNGGTVGSLLQNYTARDMGLTDYGHIQTPPNYITYGSNPQIDRFGNSEQPGQPPFPGDVNYVAPGNDDNDWWFHKPAWASLPAAEHVDSPYGTEWLRAIGGGQISVFGLMSPRLNPRTNDGSAPSSAFIYYNNLCTFLPGGWIYSWLSDSFYAGLQCLRAGGSLSFLVTGEPLANGLPDQDSVLSLLAMGYAGTSVAMRSAHSMTMPSTANSGDASIAFGNSTHYISAWGDPLYTPYKQSAIKTHYGERL